MPFYYEMTCVLDDGDAIISEDPELPFGMGPWIGGEPFEMEVPQPLIFKIEDDDEGIMLPMFEETCLLIEKKLIASIKKCGVDNLNCYNATIVETDNGREYSNYDAVNIIGLVRAADMSNSEGKDIGLVPDGLTTVFFNKLVLDETKIPKNLLIFRLAESSSMIIVHEKVRDFLIEKGYDRIEFNKLDS